MITQLIWTTWTSLSPVRDRPLNSLTHSLTVKSFELNTFFWVFFFCVVSVFFGFTLVTANKKRHQYMQLLFKLISDSSNCMYVTTFGFLCATPTLPLIHSQSPTSLELFSVLRACFVVSETHLGHWKKKTLMSMQLMSKLMSDSLEVQACDMPHPFSGSYLFWVLSFLGGVSCIGDSLRSLQKRRKVLFPCS